MRYFLFTVLVMYAVMAVSYGAWAADAQGTQTVGPLSDLVGAKAGQAENQVTQRGYVWVKTEKSDDSSYGYWTESGTGKCVVIRTTEGRYESITYAPNADCAQTASNKAAMAAPSEEGTCKLFNNKSNNYKYDGNCTIARSKSGEDEVINVTLGNGDLYHFVEEGGGYKVQTPEGWSDHAASMSQTGNKSVFDWYKWQLTVKQN